MIKTKDPLTLAMFYTQLAIGFTIVTMLWVLELPFLLFFPKLVVQTHKLSKEREKDIVAVLDRYVDRLYEWRIKDYRKKIGENIDVDSLDKPEGQWGKQ
jgi:competence protein ComGC